MHVYLYDPNKDANAMTERLGVPGSQRLESANLNQPYRGGSLQLRSAFTLYFWLGSQPWCSKAISFNVTHVLFIAFSKQLRGRVAVGNSFYFPAFLVLISSHLRRVHRHQRPHFLFGLYYHVAEARQPGPPYHSGPRSIHPPATEQQQRLRKVAAGDVRRLDGRTCPGWFRMGKIYGERNRYPSEVEEDAAYDAYLRFLFYRSLSP